MKIDELAKFFKDKSDKYIMQSNVLYAFLLQPFVIFDVNSGISEINYVPEPLYKTNEEELELELSEEYFN